MPTKKTPVKKTASTKTTTKKTTQKAGAPLAKKGSQGNRKLRNRPKTEDRIEFLKMNCNACGTHTRLSRQLKNLCLVPMPNGSYRLTDMKCTSCKYKANKFVSAEYAKELMKQGVKKCDVKEQVVGLFKK